MIEMKGHRVDFGNKSFIFENFLTLIQGKSCVGLGEVTHGTRQIFELKSELCLAAIHHLDFQAIALEIPTATGIKIDQFIKSEIESVDEILSSTYHIYNNEEFKRLLVDLRSENLKRKKERRVGIVGVDAMIDETDSQDFLNLLTADKNIFDLNECASWFCHPQTGPINQVEIKNVIQNILVREIDEMLKLRLTLMLESLVQHHERFRTRDFEGRDRNMAENVLKSRQRGKTIFWGHNTHVSARSTPNPATTWMLRPAGFFLRKELGNDYVSLGTLIGDGEIWALHEEPAGCFSELPERFQLTGIADNRELWEHSFAALSSARVTWIPTTDIGLGEKKRIRSFLGSYDPAHGDKKYEIEIFPKEEFDALIFLPRSDIPTPID
jgi:erythromycin esterase-like protein